MKRRITIGIDEVGRAASALRRRASPNSRILVGIDEVGRGALAGPVVLAAVLVVGRVRWTHPKFGRIRDSKKLTPKLREEWFGYLANHPSLEWKICRVGPAVIDRINITRAANLAALRLAAGMTWRNINRKLFFWLDGGLSLPQNIAHRSLIKGDERMPIIAAASIVAKVSRDRYMRRLAKFFPNYGFDIHKGYGTRLHGRMLKRYGLSPVHRRTFCRRWV